MRPQKHVSRAPPCCRNMAARALCITIPDDRGDESFADDLNMGRGIVSGRVALLLRSTEIRPHRPKDLLPPSPPPNPGSSKSNTLLCLPRENPPSPRLLSGHSHPGLGRRTGSRRTVGTRKRSRGWEENRDLEEKIRTAKRIGTWKKIGTGTAGVDLGAGVGSRGGSRDATGARGGTPDSDIGSPARVSGHNISGSRDSGYRESGYRDRVSGLQLPNSLPGLGLPGQGFFFFLT